MWVAQVYAPVLCLGPVMGDSPPVTWDADLTAGDSHGFRVSSPPAELEAELELEWGKSTQQGMGI